jgi:hypothetical protein
MHGSRRRLLTLTAGMWTAVGACRSGGSPGGSFEESAPRVPRGAYDYVANLPGYRGSGIVAILADTIILEPSDISCRPAMGTPSLTTITYECFSVGRFERVVFALDRRNAVQQSTWTAMERVTRTRRVCTQQSIGPTGQRVCARYQTENYEELLRHTGALQLVPRGDGRT